MHLSAEEFRKIALAAIEKSVANSDSEILKEVWAIVPHGEEAILDENKFKTAVTAWALVYLDEV